MQTVRIAAVIFNSPEAGLKKTSTAWRVGWAAAAGEGAVIVCFPEMNITGYGVDPSIRESATSLPGQSPTICAFWPNVIRWSFWRRS